MHAWCACLLSCMLVPIVKDLRPSDRLCEVNVVSPPLSVPVWYWLLQLCQHAWLLREVSVCWCRLLPHRQGIIKLLTFTSQRILPQPAGSSCVCALLLHVLIKTLLLFCSSQCLWGEGVWCWWMDNLSLPPVRLRGGVGGGHCHPSDEWCLKRVNPRTGLGDTG